MPLKVEFSFYPYLLSPTTTTINQFTLPRNATNIFPSLVSIHIHSFIKSYWFILPRLSDCSLPGSLLQLLLLRDSRPLQYIQHMATKC